MSPFISFDDERCTSKLVIFEDAGRFLGKLQTFFLYGCILSLAKLVNDCYSALCMGSIAFHAERHNVNVMSSWRQLLAVVRLL